MSELRHSPLEPLHVELGATLTEYAGWRLPLRFGGELEEHRAVRESCGLFDISHMGQLSVIGPDAASALAGALVADVTKLALDAARYTMICNESGGVLDDLIVYRIADEEFLVIANAANTEVVVRALEARLEDHDAEIADQTAERALLSLQGPRAADIITSLLGDEAELPSRFHLTRLEIAGQDALLARTGYTGEDGFELSVDRNSAAPLWRQLLSGAAAARVTPVGLAARDSLRLEAGLPLYGHELSALRTPYEAGLGWTVDLEHDFVGGDALARASSTESEECLVGLLAMSPRVPRQGYLVFDHDGRHVGAVTSGAPSPTLGKPIAMAYVLRSVGLPGGMLEIDIRGRREQAEAVPLPFWRRQRPTR